MVSETGDTDSARPKEPRYRSYQREWARRAYEKNRGKFLDRSHKRRAERGDLINRQSRDRAVERKHLAQTARWSAYMADLPDLGLPSGEQLKLWLIARGWRPSRLAGEIGVSARSVFDWLREKFPPSDGHRRELYRITGLECFRPAGVGAESAIESVRAGLVHHVRDLEAYRAHPHLEESRGLPFRVCRECGRQCERPHVHIVSEHSKDLLEWLERWLARRAARARKHADKLAKRVQSTRPDGKRALIAYRLRWKFKLREPLATTQARNRARELAKHRGLAQSGTPTQKKARISSPRDVDWVKAVELLRTGASEDECAKALGLSLSAFHRLAREKGWDTRAGLRRRNLVVSYLAALRGRLISTSRNLTVDEILGWHEEQKRSEQDSKGTFHMFDRFLPELSEELRRPGTISTLRRDFKFAFAVASSILRPRATVRAKSPNGQAHQKPPTAHDARGGKLPPKKQDMSEYFDSAKLTHRQRECISYRLEYGFIETQIAGKLGIDRTTVREHIAAARKKIEIARAGERREKRKAKHAIE